MSDYRYDNSVEGQGSQVGCTHDILCADEDLMMEQILANINSTPLGQVLKNIASLPEIRHSKVLGVRRQLTQGSYDLDERLDLAVDKVLEDLIL